LKEVNIATTVNEAGLAQTAVLRRALSDMNDPSAAADLLFLEAWERSSVFCVATVMRASQIRRANPGLAAEIRADLQRC